MVNGTHDEAIPREAAHGARGEAGDAINPETRDAVRRYVERALGARA